MEVMVSAGAVWLSETAGFGLEFSKILKSDFCSLSPILSLSHCSNQVYFQYKTFLRVRIA